MQTVPKRPKCSECGNTDFKERDGYRWCTRCGTGVPILEVHRVPGVGADTHVAPEGALAFGSDRGNTAVNSKRERFALHNVLRNAPAGLDNLGIRVIQTKAECALAEECSRLRVGAVTRRMKSHVSNLMKTIGWRNEVVFAHRIGRNINFVGGVLDMLSDGSHSKCLANGLLVYDAQKWFGLDVGAKLMADLNVKKEHVEAAKQIVQLRRTVEFLAHARRE